MGIRPPLQDDQPGLKPVVAQPIIQRPPPTQDQPGLEPVVLHLVKQHAPPTREDQPGLEAVTPSSIPQQAPTSHEDQPGLEPVVVPSASQRAPTPQEDQPGLEPIAMNQGQPGLGPVAQRSIVEQTQAAAASAVRTPEHTRSTGYDALFEETDLITADASEDDEALPAYGESYGEIRNEKDGFSTSARVSDDGRVNIRVNQLNRRLSQIFTPALRAQAQSAQDSRPAPPPYIPPSLGGAEGVPPPPPLNVVIQIVGSRGDVQPFIALGKVLKNTYGHRVRIATHPNFKDFVQGNGLEFFSIGGDPSRLMAFMVKNPSLMPGFHSLMSGDVSQRRKDVAEYIQGCWRSCYQAGDGMSPPATGDDLSENSKRNFVADCIIANPPSFAHVHCAEKLGIPLHIMFTMPYSPTQAFPHPLANVQSSNANPQLTNYISYAMIEVLSWQGLGDIINRFRAKCLGLEPVSLIWAPGMLQRLQVPHTYCWSPALIPKPKDWGSHISISGFYFLDSGSNFTPAPDLQAFLDDGPPPVYIGFGSIVLEDPDAMTQLIFSAVKKTGQRVLLSKGWGGMGADKLEIPDSVFLLGNVPHDWLFKRVSCVVHHGGAGTTAAGIAAGRPTVIVPFFGDQPFWGAMVAQAGAGPDPIPHKQLTADNLADAIDFCLKPERLERAKVLADKIATEQGSGTGAQSFHQFLEPDRLRCTLAPSRAAAWRIRRTKVRLSAFAACTLANAGLLDFHDLKLFRAQEYQTDEGPWDPISGFAAATFGAFSSMTMGLADFPAETFRAVQMPIQSSRRQSRKVPPTKAKKDESPQAIETTAPQTQGQSSLNDQQALARPRSSSNLSVTSSFISAVGSETKSNALQGSPKSKAKEYDQSKLHSGTASGSSKNQDMLRRKGAHTSKGFGRIAKAALSAPMDMSMSITKGFHNAPKLWGDDTVRPQEQVTDLKSGARALGKEFGFGMYDGVTGLFTQPWKGARKEGASGFFKGIGKGIGGFATKPGAALFAIPSYMMKGVHKEVQKMFVTNVQSYIIASRTAQGYEEWLQSSEAEKQDVIDRWKLIQKYLKKKHNADEMMQDILETQRTRSRDGRETHQNSASRPRFSQSVDGDATHLDLETALSATSSSLSFVDSLPAFEANETFSPSDQDQFSEYAEENMNPSAMRRASTASEPEHQQHESEASQYQEQLKQATAQSLQEHRQQSSVSGGQPITSRDARIADAFERTTRHSETRPKRVAVTRRGLPQSAQASSSYDPGHLAGITQSDFEAQQQRQGGEKTAQERTEEEIVLEYIKKQSLLEAQHHNAGKARASVVDDEDDEDLQMALKLSMQEHGRNP